MLPSTAEGDHISEEEDHQEDHLKEQIEQTALEILPIKKSSAPTSIRT